MPEQYSSRSTLAAAIVRSGGVAAALEAGLDADPMPDDELFGAWTQLRQAWVSYQAALTRVAEYLPETQPSRPAGPAEPVDPQNLTAGFTVYRYTEATGRHLESWTPCCGRPIQLSRGQVSTWAVCCSCQLSYDCTLIDDNDGGHYARFLLTPHTLVVAKHRSPPQQALSPPPQHQTGATHPPSR